jgi:serine/threonine-protein kinase RsbW
VLHGNSLEAHKLVHIHCCCEPNNGVCIVVRDQGKGFDPSQVPDPLALENLSAEHGRGIHLMKLAMDKVSFGRKGTEVLLHKATERKDLIRHQSRLAPRWLVRPSLGGS